MEKRLVLFLALSLITIVGYPYLMERVTGPTTPPAPQGAVNPSAAPQPAALGAPAAPSATSSATLATTSPTDSPVSGDSVTKMPPIVATEKVVESDLYRVVLSSRGGTVRSWELKKYLQKDAKGVEHPISLVPQTPLTRPLSIVGLEDATFTLDPAPLRLSAGQPEGRVVMAYTDPAGRQVRKEMRFHHDSYAVDLRVTGQAAGERLSLGTNFGISDWTAQYGSTIGVISLVDHKIVREQPSAEAREVAHGTSPQWVALQDKYFIGALAPKVRERTTLTSTALYQGENQLSVELWDGSGKGDATGSEYLLYAGPKEYDRLTALRVELEESIDFGWFIAGSWLPVRLVAKPLFYTLNFVYQFCSNYGVAIILLTLLIKIAFFPLTKKSMVSMKAMAALQPKVEAIRKRWEKDKVKMNTELMSLYKEKGANPLGGCLPVLLQIPVFIALFNVLYVTIELRQAPFFLWITDLSVQDPYYVLPVIMGITMFIQQWIQPNTMDPTQAKIMLAMPVIYTIFSVSFPSGLILYWTVNNLLTVAQQYLINRSTVIS
jgi:YidC/Oxa1 family membrane protein insertase